VLKSPQFRIYLIGYSRFSSCGSIPPKRDLNPDTKLTLSASMDVILEEHFQRVETALNTLIDSITTYNPSVQAAEDLVVADDEFSKGLEQCKAIQYFNGTDIKLISASGSTPSEPRTHPQITPNHGIPR
jgi:hypothetical protein